MSRPTTKCLKKNQKEVELLRQGNENCLLSISSFWLDGTWKYLTENEGVLFFLKKPNRRNKRLYHMSHLTRSQRWHTLDLNGKAGRGKRISQQTGRTRFWDMTGIWCWQGEVTLSFNHGIEVGLENLGSNQVNVNIHGNRYSSWGVTEGPHAWRFLLSDGWWHPRCQELFSNHSPILSFIRSFKKYLLSTYSGTVVGQGYLWWIQTELPSRSMQFGRGDWPH